MLYIPCVSYVMFTTSFEHALTWPHFTDEEVETQRGKVTCVREGTKLIEKAKTRTQSLGAGGDHHQRTVSLRKIQRRSTQNLS